MSGTESNNSSRPDAPTSATEQTAAQKLAAELMSTDEFSQYLLKSKGEMFAVFRGMVEHVSQITMFFNEGRDMVLTDMIAYGDNGIYLDLGASEEMNRKALEADKLFCVTLLDKVKVQFILRSLRRVEHKGGPAFLAPLPDSVLRLQRREYFRLSTPIAKPVKFVATIKRVDGSTLVAEASLLDISGGGVGLMATPSLAALLPSGMALNECKMTLPDEGLLVANLCVRNKFDVTTRGGARYVRVGCEFVALPGARTSMVQRYITRIERERKARLSGMA